MTASTRALRVEVADRVGEHGPAWDRLTDDLALPTPFLRSWWVDVVVVARPVILLVFDGEELVGGLPLEQTRRLPCPTLRLVGAHLGADHMDLLAAPGHEQAVSAAVRAWLARGQRLLQLDSVPPHSRLADVLPGRVTCQGLSRAPYGPLPDDFHRFVASRGHVLQRDLRRLWRRQEREGIRYRVVGADGLDEAVAALHRLHSAFFAERSAFTPNFDGFARSVPEGFARGELALHVLETDEAGIIAVQACFDVAGRTSHFQGGRDVSDPRFKGMGTLLIASIMRSSIERGQHEFDFLRGDNAYKYAFVDHARPVGRRTTSHGLLAGTVRRVVPAVARVRSRVKARSHGV